MRIFLSIGHLGASLPGDVARMLGFVFTLGSAARGARQIVLLLIETALALLARVGAALNAMWIGAPVRLIKTVSCSSPPSPPTVAGLVVGTAGSDCPDGRARGAGLPLNGTRHGRRTGREDRKTPEKKFREAREKGQGCAQRRHRQARSRRFPSRACSSGSAADGAAPGGPDDRFVDGRRRLADATCLLMGDVAGAVERAFIGLPVGPIAVTAAVMSVVVGRAGRAAVVRHAVAVQLSRLNPATGLSRLVLSKSGIDTLKAVVTAYRCRCRSRGQLRWQSTRCGFRGCLRPAQPGYGWSRIVRLPGQAGSHAATSAPPTTAQFWRHSS